jgi:hypothetical protein
MAIVGAGSRVCDQAALIQKGRCALAFSRLDAANLGGFDAVEKSIEEADDDCN